MANAGVWGPQAITDGRGNAQVGAKAYVYELGTDTLATLYTDRAKSSTADNPVDVDENANLRFFADPSMYRVEIYRDGIKRFEFEAPAHYDPEGPADQHRAQHEPGGSDDLSGTFQRRHALDLRNFGAPTAPDSAWQAMRDALDQGEVDVVVSGGTYLFDAPIELGSNQGVYIASDAKVVVSNGYTGTLFRFNGVTTTQRFADVMGPGAIAEWDAANAQRLWNAFEFFADGVGCDMNLVFGPRVSNVGTLFRCREINNGSVSANHALHVNAFYPETIIEFDETGSRIGVNNFEHITVQATDNFRYGLKNISGISNRFAHIVPFDMDNATDLQAAVEITSRADETVIEGGGLTSIEPNSAPVTDNGTNTHWVGVPKHRQSWNEKPSARLERDTNQSISDSTVTAVTWEKAAHDNTGGSMWASGSPTILSLPEAGIYLLSIGTAWGSNNTGLRLGEVRTTGGEVLVADRRDARDISEAALSTVVSVTSATDIELRVYQTSGAALDFRGSDRRSFLSAQKISEMPVT